MQNSVLSGTNSKLLTYYGVHTAWPLPYCIVVLPPVEFT